MTSFKKFGEAARLYAENADLVEAMKSKMKEDISAFIRDLGTTLKSRLAPIKLMTYQNTSAGIDWYCFFPNDWDRATLWFHRWSPALVEPGEMTFGLYNPYKVHDYDKSLVAKTIAATELPMVKWIENEDAILRGKISYGRTANPVETCAPVFEILLRKLEEAHLAGEK